MSGPGRVLLGKEIREILRTSRLYVVPGIFFFFGLISPLTAKLMPEIIKSLGGTGGLEIVLPPPTAADAFLQFFKNLLQVGVLAVILTNMGIVAEEKGRGTAILVVTKPASRAAFVGAKFVASLLLVLAATAVAYGGALFYTWYLFPSPPLKASLAATLLFAVHVTFILALTVFASALTRSQVAAGGLAILGLFADSALPSLGGFLAKWAPGAVSGFVYKVTAGQAGLGEAVPSVVVALGLSVLLVALGALVFERQEL